MNTVEYDVYADRYTERMLNAWYTEEDDVYVPEIIDYEFEDDDE